MNQIETRNNFFENASHYLLICFSLFFPISVFLGNLFAISLVLAWILFPGLKARFYFVKNDTLVRYFALFFLLHVVGLLWTEDIQWGLYTLKKMLEFIILFPVLVSLIQKDKKEKYIYVFILSVSISVFFSYLIYFEFLEPFKNATLVNPTPFMSHISHGPFVAFSSFLILNFLFRYIEKKMFNYRFLLLFILFIIFSLNVFLTGGRTGYISYILLTFLAIFQSYSSGKKHISALLFFLVSIGLVSVFNFGEIFRDRVYEGFNDIEKYYQEPYSNIGIRLKIAENSLPIIKNNLVYGAGTGDFPLEYRKINSTLSPSMPESENPHNMYILLMVQFGLIGIAIYFLMLFKQWKLVSKNTGIFKSSGHGLIIFFVFINFGDSYFLGHFSSFLYIFFSAIFNHLKSNEKHTL